MPEFIEVCERAAREGGAVLLDWQNRIRVREKGPADLVTEADLASQKVIRETLLAEYPEHAFLGEEDAASHDLLTRAGEGENDPEKYCWVVDPLDGTTNYVHGVPSFAVSIALVRGTKPIVGVVYDPSSGECFSAVAAQGARLNGERIHVSRCVKLQRALVAGSFSVRVPRDSVEIGRFIEILHECRAIRRLGSAALNLAYVAAGRFDAYFASSLKPWDVAAGVLLVREAGGLISNISGSSFRLDRPEIAVSATSELHAEILCRLARAAE